VMEDRSLLRSLDKTLPRRSGWFVIRTTLGFIFHNVALMIRNRWRRFGYAAVNFGRPISVHDYCRSKGLDLRRLTTEDRHAEIEKFGCSLMTAISVLVPAVPIPIAAATLLRAGSAGLNEFDWKGVFYKMTGDLRASGMFVTVPTVTQEHAFEIAVNMLTLRRLVVKEGDVFRVAPDAREVLQYYANSLAVVPA